MKNRIIVFLLLTGIFFPVMAGQPLLPLSYRQYMEKVIAGNFEYAAERLKVSVSDAELVASKVFNDPNLSVSYFNNENSSLKMGEGVEVELSKTFTLGKRGAGIALAKSEKQLAEALLEDYLRNLQADATLAYLEAIKQNEVYKVKANSYGAVRRLAESDSLRHALGKIKEVDAIQSRVEADMIRNELKQAQVELLNAFGRLNLYTGTQGKDSVFQPDARLESKSREFILQNLLRSAGENRSDIVAALKNKEVANRALTVTRRERNTDIDLSLAVSRNARVHNEEAPAPPFTGITAGIAIPLKFSNFNKGAVHAARFREQQAEAQYQQALLQVETEVMQAFRNYESYSEQVQHYEKGLLQAAREVIEGKTYSYDRGEVSLLEVLDAQRTFDDVQTQYIETLYQSNAALVELERSAGLWDLEF